MRCWVFFVKVTAATAIYTYVHTLALHDALPISGRPDSRVGSGNRATAAQAFPHSGGSVAPARRSTRECLQTRRGRHGGSIWQRSEEHTSELQSLMRISYAVFCLKQKNNSREQNNDQHTVYIAM